MVVDGTTEGLVQHAVIKHCADSAYLNEIAFTQRLCTMIRKRPEMRNVSYRRPLCTSVKTDTDEN